MKGHRLNWDLDSRGDSWMFIYEGGISEQKSGGKFKKFVFKPYEHDRDIFLK